MTNLTGRELEDFGQRVFSLLGLRCFHRLNHVRLRDLDPSAPYAQGEHLEFDFLLPWHEVCFIGCITGARNIRGVRRSYRNFRGHYDIIRGLNLRPQTWQLLGVEQDHLRYFQETRSLRGFFITTNLQRFDVNLPNVPEIVCFYKSDWGLIGDYSTTLGHYARDHFLHRFDILPQEHRRSITISADRNALMRTPRRRVASGDVGLANVYTFEASPYELLPIAHVWRRDQLPNLSPELEPAYQRPLLMGKLKDIRENLLSDPDFIFPNSILVVMSGDCRYDNETLMIPERYGALEIIDGQHRLFSYANDDIHDAVGEDSKIMVTAIEFIDVDEATIRQYSAKTFIEINTNQTRVRQTHLDAVAYPILGETTSRAIAAQIILLANERRRSSLFGIFDTNQTGLGIVQSITVLTALKSITNLGRIGRLQRAQRETSRRERDGFEKLFNISIDALMNADGNLDRAELLIRHGVICFERFFNIVADVFSYDWPQRGANNRSSLRYAKMIAAFVRLLNQFIKEGYGWVSVRHQLEMIKRNVLRLQGRQRYRNILFDPADQNIPDARPRPTDHYLFLDRNRYNPTSIQDIIHERSNP